MGNRYADEFERVRRIFSSYSETRGFSEISRIEDSVAKGFLINGLFGLHEIEASYQNSSENYVPADVRN